MLEPEYLNELAGGQHRTIKSEGKSLLGFR